MKVMKMVHWIRGTCGARKLKVTKNMKTPTFMNSPTSLFRRNVARASVLRPIAREAISLSDSFWANLLMGKKKSNWMSREIRALFRKRSAFPMAWNFS